MSSSSPASLQRLQRISRAYFEQWGRFVAGNQVATILATATAIFLVVTSALGLYFTSPDSVSLWEFLSRPLQRLYPADTAIWWGDNVQVSADERCWSLYPVSRPIRVESVWITRDDYSNAKSPFVDYGVIDKPVLHHAWSLATQLDHSLLSSLNNQYLGSTNPLHFWNNDEHQLLSDPSPLNSLQLFPEPQWTQSGFPFTLKSTFAHRTFSHIYPSLLSSEYIVHTTFLIDSPSARDRYLNSLRSISQAFGSLSIYPYTGSRNILLKRQFSSDLRPLSSQYEDVLILLGYVGVGLYVYFTLRRIDRVHSRTGLVLTGLIQMFASGLLSLSACKLAKLQFGLVPWKLIPFLIVVLGVDSNFLLIKAVTSTSVELPIRDRIGKGLSAVGLQLISSFAVEVCVWGICYIFIGPGSIRELLLFALVALIADYALQSTFFLTVLSIDIQRFELADLLRLRQGGNESSSEIVDNSVASPTDREMTGSSPWDVIWAGVKSGIRARAARAVVFLLIVTANIILYIKNGSSYYHPPFCATINSSSSFTNTTTLDHIAPSQEDLFWNILNPLDNPVVHVTISPPTILSLGTPNGTSHTTTIILSKNILFRIFDLFKRHFVPVIAIDACLYLLLRYLLKGAELLRAAKSTRNDDSEDSQEDSVTNRLSRKSKQIGNVKFHMSSYLTTHEADLEVITCSKKHVLSWSTFDNHVTLSTIPTCSNGDISGSTKSSVIRIPHAYPAPATALDIDNDAKYVAIADSSGQVVIWELVPHLQRNKFQADIPSSDDGHIIALFAHRSKSIFYSVYHNSIIIEWDCVQNQARKTVLFDHLNPSNDSTRKLRLVRVNQPKQETDGNNVYPMLVSLGNNGESHESTLSVWQNNDSGQWTECGPTVDISSIDTNDRLTTLTTGNFAIDGKMRNVLAIGTRSGKVGMWDLQTGQQVVSLTITLEEPITKVRLARALQLRCFTCQGQISDGFFLVVGTSNQVKVYRVFSAPRECQPTTSSLSSTPNSTSGFSSPTAVWQIHYSLYTGSSSPSLSKSSSSSSINNIYSQSPASPTGTRKRRKDGVDDVSTSEDGSVPIRIACHGLRRSNERRKRSSSLAETALDDPKNMSGIKIRKSRLDDVTEGVRLSSNNSERDAINNLWGDPRIQEQAFLEKDVRGTWDVCDQVVVGVSRKKSMSSSSLRPRRKQKSLSSLSSCSTKSPSWASSWEAWTINLAPAHGSLKSELPVWKGPLWRAPSEKPNYHHDDILLQQRQDPQYKQISMLGRILSFFSPKTSRSLTSSLNGDGSPSLRKSKTNLEENKNNYKKMIAFSNTQCSTVSKDGKKLVVGMGNCVAVLEQDVEDVNISKKKD